MKTDITVTSDQRRIITLMANSPFDENLIQLFYQEDLLECSLNTSTNIFISNQVNTLMIEISERKPDQINHNLKNVVKEACEIIASLECHTPHVAEKLRADRFLETHQ